jgi:hypothetical protein
LPIIRRYVEAIRSRNLVVRRTLPNKALADREITMPSLHNIPAVLAGAVAGALIAYAAYRRSGKRMAQKQTAHDLRTELRAERESLRAAVEALSAQIDLAKRSRVAAAHAAGNVASEGLQQWLCELDLDLAEAELLRSQLPAADADYKALSDMDVEIELVEVLALSLRASPLTEKYRASISVSDAPISLQETDTESLTEDAEALLPEPSQYSLNNARSSIAENARSSIAENARSSIAEVV